MMIWYIVLFILLYNFDPWWLNIKILPLLSRDLLAIAVSCFSVSVSPPICTTCFCLSDSDVCNEKSRCCWDSVGNFFRVGSFSLRIGAGGWKLYRRVPRMVLPIHLSRHFCCRMYRLAPMHCDASQTDRQTDRQTDDIILPIADHTAKTKHAQSLKDYRN